MSPHLRRPHGFTLVELAIVLVIVALLTGGMLFSLSAQTEVRDNGDTRKQLQDIGDALIGYAASHYSSSGQHPFLPCPDTDYDGVEEARDGSGNCPSAEGVLPWTSLGLGQYDSWRNHYRYRVHTRFSNNKDGFGLATSAGDITVCSVASASSGCSVANSTLASGLPALVLSHGKNGLGAINAQGAANGASSDGDEVENHDGDNVFVSRAVTQQGFDDQVLWLSPNLLFNRLIAAGRSL